MPEHRTQGKLESPVHVETIAGGEFQWIRLHAPKANIIDSAMIAALSECLEAAAKSPKLKVIAIEGSGRHFSFGASVEEHRPESVGTMLTALHRLFLQLLSLPVMSFAVVRGQCLGGGLELVLGCHRVFAAEDATLGQPEIQLGVFAPIGSVMLPKRVGFAAANDLLLSGRSLHAKEAQEIGLVDECSQDPGAAAWAYYREYLAHHSASSLRYALKATNFERVQACRRELANAESIYLEELMQTHDAVEGISAFLEKRTPHWRNQ